MDFAAVDLNAHAFASTAPMIASFTESESHRLGLRGVGFSVNVGRRSNIVITNFLSGRASVERFMINATRQLAKMPGYSLERLLGRAAGEKLTALAWNRDPREIRTHHRAQSAGAQSALGNKPAEEQVFRPTLRHLADRVASRLRAKSRPGWTVTIRVRFADLHWVTRSVTLDEPISATATLRNRRGARSYGARRSS